MGQGITEKRKTFLFLGLFLAYIARWVLSLGVSILIFWVMTDGNFSFTDQSQSDKKSLLDLGVSPIFSSDTFFADLLKLAMIVCVGFAINSLISCFAVTHLGRKNNRLWAFFVLMLVPFLVIGVLAGFSPISEAINPLSILFSAMLIDLLMVILIGWRMVINRSPFEGMNLIDNSEYVWE